MHRHAVAGSAGDPPADPLRHTGRRATVRASADWLAHFHANRASLRTIPWSLGVRLDAHQRAALIPSIQEFQLGESSDGQALRRAARSWAAGSGDHIYLEALEYLIAEEQRHGRDLGRALALAGAPRLTRSWTDAVFRQLRRAGGLELSIAVLITAEIIALVYYPALRAATHEPVLRRLCDQIIADERVHVRFQAEQLAVMRAGRRRSMQAVTAALHGLFMVATAAVVWRRHRSALRRGGLDALGYARAVQRAFTRTRRWMDPRRYRW